MKAGITFSTFDLFHAGHVKMLEEGKPLTVVSPGNQVRNFTHIDDIIEGLILVAEKGNRDGFGIGSKESYTIFEIANMFNQKIEIIPERNGNRMIAELVTQKTENLGWTAKKKH